MHKRLFLGIPLSDTVKTKLHDSLTPLQELYPLWKWVKEENFHITVSFFGSVAEEKIPLLSEVVNETIKKTPQFSLRLNELLLTPPHQKPRMLWAVASTSSEFSVLVHDIETAVGQNTELPDYRKSADPIPHVTLARFKSQELNTEISFPTLDLKEEVTSITLFGSVLSNRGPHYTDIANYPLVEP